MASGFTLPPLPKSNWGSDDDRMFRQESMRQKYGRGPVQDAYNDRGDDYDEDDDEFRPRNARRENALLARLSKDVPRVPWDIFIRDELQWAMGEHFALIGPTGLGKTTMLLNLLPLHPFVAVFATKPRDDSMDRLLMEGYIRLDRWRSLDATIYPHRVLWPDATSLDSEDKQKEVFADAFARIYREGGWTVALDELWYIINVLGLSRAVRTFLLQARALGISLVCATQRPAYVPLEVYDQSTHLMFWRDNDETNLKRLSGLAGNSASLIRSTVANLDKFQVMYLNTRTGRMLRTRCPAD